MFDAGAGGKQAIRDLLDSFEPGTLLASDAKRPVVELAELERLVVAVKTLCAARVADAFRAGEPSSAQVKAVADGAARGRWRLTADALIALARRSLSGATEPTPGGEDTVDTSLTNPGVNTTAKAKTRRSDGSRSEIIVRIDHPARQRVGWAAGQTWQTSQKKVERCWNLALCTRLRRHRRQGCFSRS